MMTRKAGFFLALLAFSFSLASVPVKKRPAPEIVGKTHDGKTVRLSDFRGKVVLIDFWASWCGPCKEEFPFLVQLHEKLKHKNFTVLAVNVDTEIEDMANFIAKQKVKPSFPIIVDPEGKIAERYKLKGMPTTVMVDKQGNIRYRHTGFKPEDKKRIIKEIMSLL